MKSVVVAIGYILALFVFQGGFLLKRRELPRRSSCSDMPVAGSSCWMANSVGRVIFVVIDALRYDFLDPRSNHSAELPYLNKMKFVASLSESAIISPILADPPTTTLQRLKGMTTGTLPTFIDASDNFSPNAEIKEDNLLDQLRALGKNITLLGDDTWTSLYPGRFHRAVPMPSFDVYDLHTVDDAVIKHLPFELQQTDTQLLIVHFLGVDHCGHRYGPSHSEMAKKLRQMDNAIEYIVRRLRDDDLLVIMGDHGMTATGDHGGDAEAEITAGLLIYSPHRHFDALDTTPRQIDLVPSLALLLGAPIPFSSLGTVIPQLFPDGPQRELATQLNFEQVLRFSRTYSSISPDVPGSLPHYSDSVLSWQERVNTVRRVQAVFRSAWTEFDLPLMGLGLLCLIENFLLSQSAEPFTVATFVSRTAIFLLQLSALSRNSNELSEPLLLFSLLGFGCYHLAHIFQHSYGTRTHNLKFIAYGAAFLTNVSFFSNSFVVREAEVLRYVLQTFVLGSLLIKVQSWPKKLSGARIASRTLSQLIASDSIVGSLCIVALLRLEPIFHRCREEEGAACEQFFTTVLSTALPTDIRAFRLFFAVLSTFMLRWLLRNRTSWFLPLFSGSKQSSFDRLNDGLITLIHLVIYFNWGLDLLPHSMGQINSALLISSWITYLLIFTVIALNLASTQIDNTSRLLGIVQAALAFVLLLLGDGLASAVVAFLVISVKLPSLVQPEFRDVASSLLPAFGFYYLGHSPTLSAIPWTAAFVGVPGTWGLRVVPGILVLCHLYAGTVIHLLSQALLHRHIQSNAIISFAAWRSIAVCLAATILRRHLMVWKIFAPRFIFEAVSFIFLAILVHAGRLFRKAFAV